MLGSWINSPRQTQPMKKATEDTSFLILQVTLLRNDLITQRFPVGLNPAAHTAYLHSILLCINFPSFPVFLYHPQWCCRESAPNQPLYSGHYFQGLFGELNLSYWFYWVTFKNAQYIWSRPWIFKNLHFRLIVLGVKQINVLVLPVCLLRTLLLELSYSRI